MSRKNPMVSGGLDGSQLKWIAVLTMLVDHTAFLLLGRGLLPALIAELRVLTGSNTGQPLLTALRSSYAHWHLLYQAMRSVGRIAFPVYAFLLVEGFFCTRDWRRYAVRLGVFALLSEIPFNLMIASQIYSLKAQNIFFTLLLGLLMVKVLDALNQNHPDTRDSSITGTDGSGVFSSGARHLHVSDNRPFRSSAMSAVPAPIRLPQILVMAAFAALAWYLRTDYDYMGILLIALFYWFRSDRKRACLLGFLWMACLNGSWYSLPGYALSFVLIWLYNGKRGRQPWKYGFYLFYPLHILLLYGIFCRIYL